MSNRRAGRVLRVLAMFALLLAPGARAELAAWDAAQVSELAKQLAAATNELRDTFRNQPQPTLGSMQSQAYHRLKQWVRLMEIQSFALAEALQNGEGRDETLPMFDNLMQLVRSARDDAAKAFVSKDVGTRAGEVRGVLNRLGPYYDPDFDTLAPSRSIEPDAKR